MIPLGGVISDKLRALFGAKSPGYQPGRPADGPPPRAHKNPKGVDGKPLGGRKPKGGK